MRFIDATPSVPSCASAEAEGGCNRQQGDAAGKKHIILSNEKCLNVFAFFLCFLAVFTFRLLQWATGRSGRTQEISGNREYFSSPLTPAKGLTITTFMQTHPSPSNQTGSVAVTVALILTLLLGVMAFSMDTGYLYLKKNQYRNAVEAAAMAGAMALCEKDLYEIQSVVMEIAGENGIPVEKGELTVSLGYYDEMDQYSDFSEYQDFAAEESMPPDEHVNAVHVVYRSEALSLTGMGQDANISNAAVAYLKRIDIVSLDPQGAIDIGNNGIWEDVVFFSNGNINYPQTVSINTPAGTRTYSPPEFNNCRLYAAGQVLSCPVDTEGYQFGMYTRVSEIMWNSGSPQSGSHILSGADPITSIRPVDDEYLEAWRDRADVVYTPDQAGEDNIFYGASGDNYYFDSTEVSGVIFFDAGEDAGQGEVFIIGKDYAYTPNDDSITNLTFVTNCKINIHNTSYGGSGGQVVKLYVGGEDEDQAMFISTGDIEVNPTGGDDIQFNGAVFRTGGDFILNGGGGSSSHKIRVIADGSIIGESGTNTSYYARNGNSIGLHNMTNDSRFAPPCPPVMARLGLLKASEE